MFKHKHRIKYRIQHECININLSSWIMHSYAKNKIWDKMPVKGRDYPAFLNVNQVKIVHKHIIPTEKILEMLYM